MPITKAEREKLRTHTFSEDKKEEFGGTHMVAPEISVAEVISGSFGILISRPLTFVANILGSVIFAIYLFAALSTSPVLDLLLYAAMFFILEIIVVAPLTAVSRAKLANIKRASASGPMLMAFNYLEPIVPILYIAGAVLAVELVQSPSWELLGGAAVVLVLAFILQIMNLDSSISVYMYYDKKLDRATAMSRSWFFLSGQSVRILCVSTVAFLPLIVAVLLDICLRNTGQVWYMIPLVLLVADFCYSWWDACTAYIYGETAKKAKPMPYSRL